MPDLFDHLSPGETPSFDDVVQAMRDLHEAQQNISVNDLPMRQLQDRLEMDWQPDLSLLASIPLPQGVEIRYGGVAASGARAFGDGFTSVKIATGTYTIQFTGGFSPKVLVGNSTVGSARTFSPYSFSATGVQVICAVSSAGTAIDDSFCFICIGTMS